MRRFKTADEYRQHLIATVPNGLFCIKNDETGKFYTGKLGYIDYKVALWEHFNGGQKPSEGLNAIK